MLLQLGGQEYVDKIAAVLRMVKSLNADGAARANWQAFGVDYIYIGARGNFADPGLDGARLSQVATVVYQRERVTIMKFGP